MTSNLFTPEDTAILLIDHQVGTMSWVRSGDRDEMKANALALAKAAKALGMPLVLTSSLEDHQQGPLAEELKDIAPEEYANRIQRVGVVNALEDENFAAAVRGTGRKNLVVAGVTNDVCTVYPTLTALQDGYRVQVVADAGGSMSKLADDVALRRMENAGAGITSTNMILTELARNWASAAGEALIPIVGALIPQ
ncbi:isochorismatase [Kribbella sp. ALI-6-A]|uniref:isochorismatase family protein n=1 Tax=Kribbella sp. ALI-6-A TaxID=1933817 RepID=UPI00097C4EA6|nr:isochorismatase family protein [Kribbella sp. ALI-6-A]ONI74365.1 isochorismatase [Kribbella sp. ALI-6-A]